MKVKDTPEIRKRLEEYEKAAYATLAMAEYTPEHVVHDWKFEKVIPCGNEFDWYDEENDRWEDPEPEGLDETGKKKWWLGEYVKMRRQELEESGSYAYDIKPPGDPEDIFLPHVERYDRDWYENDPYVQNVYSPGWYSENFCVGDGGAEFCESFSYNSPIQDSKNPALFVPRLCYNTAPLYELNEMFDPETAKTLSSTHPKEILETGKYIDRAHGNVLVFGMGIGYFAYMAAMKENVSSVTVVEEDPYLVDYMKEYVLPQMECKDKIHIVNSYTDGFLREVDDGEYDYCFVRFGVDSAEDYIRLQCMAKSVKGMKTDAYGEDMYLYKITMLAIKNICDSLGILFPAELAAVDMYSIGHIEERQAKCITLYLDELLKKP